jgi:cell wall-associated NlpC family hydrolase
MIPNWFNTPERLAALETEARRWVGTPWAANGDSIGLGVSCHNLPRCLYVAVGALPADFPRMEGSPDQTRHSTVSVMEPWIIARPEFRSVFGREWQPGDLLGLQIYRCVDHLGIALGGGRFLHVLSHRATMIDQLIDPTWGQRVKRVWRVPA